MATRKSPKVDPTEKAIERGVERVIERKIKSFFKSCDKDGHSWKCHHHATGGGAYFLGVVGAAVYFIMHTSGFWNIVLAILKALVWPAFVVFGLLKFLGL